MEPLVSSPIADDYIRAGSVMLRRFRNLLREARAELDVGEREHLAREVRKLVANECAAINWVLLERLHHADREVLRALILQQPSLGAWFHTTGRDIWKIADGVAHSTVYVSLRRLEALGLIERDSPHGSVGTRVRVTWRPLAASEAA